MFWNLYTESTSEGVALEVLLDDRNLLNHRLLTRFLIGGDANIIAVAVIDLRGATLDTFPPLILLQTTEDAFPCILPDVGIKEGAVMLP